MDKQTITSLMELSQAVSQPGDWKQTLNRAIIALRQIFIFDNVAIYKHDTFEQTEVLYARAVGRGQTAEADAAWGEEIASQVLSKNEIVLQEPTDVVTRDNRLRQAHLLGLPLEIDGSLYGALVFVRFGGPVFTQEQCQVATLASQQFNHLFQRNALMEKLDELEALEKQMRLQEDFVATVSHDLRTPLGFIKGYTTTLLRSDTKWDTETQKEFLTIIDEETDRLAELIENVLESARLQSQTLQMMFQPMRLDALIREITIRAQTHYRSLRVKLNMEECPPIQGDTVRLSQIFENLFSNAIKYAPGAPITVSLQNKDDYILVVFSDHGPGIPKEYLPFIFERFYRVPGQASGLGTGLGLFICKQIIQAHHGKIWARSEPGQGTQFFMEIPLIQA